MPKLELGDLKAVEKHKNANIPVLARYAKEGYAIVSAMPSCTLMFKQELPLMFPDERRRAGSSRRRCGIRSSTWWRAARTAC